MRRPQPTSEKRPAEPEHDPDDCYDGSKWVPCDDTVKVDRNQNAPPAGALYLGELPGDYRWGSYDNAGELARAKKEALRMGGNLLRIERVRAMARKDAGHDPQKIRLRVYRTRP